MLGTSPSIYKSNWNPISDLWLQCPVNHKLRNSFGIGAITKFILPVLIFDSHVYTVGLSPEVSNVQFQLNLRQNLLATASMSPNDIHVAIKNESKIPHANGGRSNTA